MLRDLTYRFINYTGHTEEQFDARVHGHVMWINDSILYLQYSFLYSLTKWLNQFPHHFIYCLSPTTTFYLISIETSEIAQLTNIRHPNIKQFILHFRVMCWHLFVLANLASWQNIDRWPNFELNLRRMSFFSKLKSIV